MREHGAEQPDDGPMSVSDEDLPEDLRPSEDNPLAEPAGDDVPADVLKDTAGGGGSTGSDDDATEDVSDESSEDG